MSAELWALNEKIQPKAQQSTGHKEGSQNAFLASSPYDELQTAEGIALI